MQTAEMCKEKAGMMESSGKEKFVFGHIFFGFSL